MIGLYIAYAIPIFLRWRMGDEFVPGPWTLGNKYKSMVARFGDDVVLYLYLVQLGLC